MKKSSEYLEQIPIFASLSQQELENVRPYIQNASYRKKEVIFAEGSEPEWFYVCQSGKVKITKLSHEGKELIIEIISPGDFFGGFAVIKGFPYPANAVAMEDTSVIRISRQDIISLIEKYPAVMHAIMSNLGMRVRDFHTSLKSIALDKVESRIVSVLLKLAEKSGVQDGADVVIDMRLTKQDIAEMVGTTVETSIRVMSQLKKTGAVSEKDGRIVLTNMGLLREKLSLVQ
ncbi:MAG: Crp/Fnr family transcriptional regulator [Nitrospiraceae bacterium]|nr:Crp/Fnr family transcriptional regulator [Nitrospiraceae bacterium]